MWSKPAAREREAEAARLEGEAGNLWNVARLEALTVYLGPVEKIDAKGPKDASWKDGFRSSKYAYPRDDLVKAELVRGELTHAPEWLRPTHKCSAFCIIRKSYVE